MDTNYLDFRFQACHTFNYSQIVSATRTFNIYILNAYIIMLTNAFSKNPNVTEQNNEG